MLTNNTMTIQELITQEAKQRRLKQADVAKILNINTRQYRRLMGKGLTFEQVNTLLKAFQMTINVQMEQKDSIIQYQIGR